MTPEELRVATTTEPPFTEPLDYMAVPYLLIKQVRWLLTTSASSPAERVAAIDALDRHIARHLNGCPRHTQETR